MKSRTVALTAPSYVVAELLKEQVPAASEALKRIDYPPVCAVTLAYPKSAIKVSPVFKVSNYIIFSCIVGLGVRVYV